MTDHYYTHNGKRFTLEALIKRSELADQWGSRIINKLAVELLATREALEDIQAITTLTTLPIGYLNQIGEIAEKVLNSEE